VNLILLLFICIIIYQTGWWLFSLQVKDNSWVDVAWGIGFVFISFLAFIQSYSIFWPKVLVLTMIALWGFRLALHIALRKRGHGEDKRYEALRHKWGKNAWWQSLIQIFWVQGLLILVVLSPVIAFMSTSVSTLSFFACLGAVMWLVGWLFETIGDFQLAQFKKHHHNKEKVMDQGLWRYTRHPNYFGEATMWWGIWLLVVVSAGLWWTIVGPLTITFLLLKVSGVTLLEKHYHGNMEYKEYQRKTSAFIPWKPKQ
jgi:steroid 5-alpha reductase family enzyme